MIWYVAVGSALGGAGRYLVTGWVQRAADSGFPLGTLTVNVVGSLLVGFLLRYSLDLPGITAEIRVMLTIGFCGGFTTFSTFSYETMALLQEGQWTRAVGYIAGSVVLSLGAAFTGFLVAHYLVSHARPA